MLEDALAGVAGQEQAIRSAGRKRREEPQLRRREVLRLVDDDMIERPGRSAFERLGENGKHVRPRRVALGLKRCTDCGEHGQETSALVRTEPALAAPAGHLE